MKAARTQTGAFFQSGSATLKVQSPIEQNSNRVWETVFEKGLALLQEVADFFFFLGSSANKDAGIAQTLFVSILFSFLSFLAVSDEERLEEEGENIKEA